MLNKGIIDKVANTLPRWLAKFADTLTGKKAAVMAPPQATDWEKGQRVEYQPTAWDVISVEGVEKGEHGTVAGAVMASGGPKVTVLWDSGYEAEVSAGSLDRIIASDKSPSRVSLAEAEAKGFFVKAQKIGFGVYADAKDNPAFDAGSVWYLEKDEKTGEQYLMKQLDATDSIVRRVRAMKKQASAGVESETEIIKTAQDFEQWYNNLLNQIKYLVGKPLDKVKDWIKRQYETVAGHGEEWKVAVRKLVKEFVTANPDYEPVLEVVKGTPGMVGADSDKGMDRAAIAGTPNYEQWYNNAMNQLKYMYKYPVERVVQWFRNLWDQVREYGMKFRRGVKELADKLVDQYPQFEPVYGVIPGFGSTSASLDVVNWSRMIRMALAGDPKPTIGDMQMWLDDAEGNIEALEALADIADHMTRDASCRGEVMADVVEPARKEIEIIVKEAEVERDSIMERMANVESSMETLALSKTAETPTEQITKIDTMMTDLKTALDTLKAQLSQTEQTLTQGAGSVIPFVKISEDDIRDEVLASMGVEAILKEIEAGAEAIISGASDEDRARLPEITAYDEWAELLNMGDAFAAAKKEAGIEEIEGVFERGAASMPPFKVRKPEGTVHEIGYGSEDGDFTVKARLLDWGRRADDNGPAES